MAGNRKRKAPSQALRSAQLQSTYVPLKRTRSDALSSIEASKLDAALSNEASYGWTLVDIRESIFKSLQYKSGGGDLQLSFVQLLSFWYHAPRR